MAMGCTVFAQAQNASAIRDGFAFDDTMTAFLQSCPDMTFDTAHYGWLPDTNALAIEGIDEQAGVNVVWFDTDGDGVMSEKNIVAMASSTGGEKDRTVIKLYWPGNENICRVFTTGQDTPLEVISRDGKLATFEQKRQKYAAAKP
jgi:hypothetical protein